MELHKLLPRSSNYSAKTYKAENSVYRIRILMYNSTKNVNEKRND